MRNRSPKPVADTSQVMRDEIIGAMVAAPADVVTVVFDENCRVCRVLMALVLMWDRRRRVTPVGFAAAQSVGAPTATDSWHLHHPEFGWRSAGAAIAPLLRALPAGSVLANVCDRWPVATERLYWAVAWRRSRLSRLLPQRLVSWADGVIAARQAR